MIVIIPLGGIGERFKKEGYKYPKALINVLGKPILFWLLDSLNVPVDTIIYIPYNKEYKSYRLEDLLKKTYPNILFKFKVLENNTRGAAETIQIALDELDIEDQPIISLDSDNFYLVNILELWEKTNYRNSVYVFNDNGNKPIYSYITVDKDNTIIDIQEKNKISTKACCGGYAFNSYRELLKYTKLIIKNNIRSKNEYYISTVIEQMLKSKSSDSFNPILVSKKDYICLGTPLQVKHFCHNPPDFPDCARFVKKLRVCFDLDNTLVSFPKIFGDYTTVEPITKNINILRHLKQMGHTIIIYTARRMKSHKGCVGKIMSDIGKITFDTLEQYDIPYDEIYFGKPYANVYIDDLALNCFDDIEKELGLHLEEVQPRHFNQLKENSIETYKKTSITDLSKEIFYYKNIPVTMRELFPALLNYDKTLFSWYEVEKIKGITASSIYVSDLMTPDLLKTIMDSIINIQSHLPNEKEKDNINIYANYQKKLEKRYTKEDYSLYSDHKKFFDEINQQLHIYEESQLGRITMIHGDPVFTNILINEYDEIKFIDMRGLVGDKLTIYGDWLYDWSKIYQSLIGYDHILLGKEINQEYQESLINYFLKYFTSIYSDKYIPYLKVITKSLLFSLLPLHKEKNVQLYGLLYSEYLD